MEGFLFYWIGWIAWVIIVFFVRKEQPFRVPVLLHLLISMTVAGYIVHIGYYEFGLVGIYLFFLVPFYIREQSLLQISYFLIVGMIIGLGFASFRLFTLLDPLWIFVNPSWLAAILLHFLTLILYRNWKRRIAALIFGLIIGDNLFMLTMVNHSLPHTAVSFEWLDILTISLGASLCWTGLEWLSILAMNYTQTRFGIGQKHI